MPEVTTDENDPKAPVYAVYFAPTSPMNNIFTSLRDATKYAGSPEGRSNGARFKKFGTPKEAKEFMSSCEMEIQASTPSAAPPSDPVVPFPSVSRPEMNVFKKVVESDDVEEFVRLCQVNPRYIINVSGDTAAITMEGFRFNALHVAARNGSSKIAKKLLELVSDLNFLQTLYGTSLEDVTFRHENIIQSYLNTPDKGNGDTPLHLAAKFGHLTTAQALVAYDACSSTLRNKSGERPCDVICSRTEKTAEAVKAFQRLFSSYFVCLYRSDTEVPEIRRSHGVPVVPSGSSLSPIRVSAVAGPFDAQAADEFRFSWKVKGRNRAERLVDAERGMEKIGRQLAEKANVDWAELWPFHHIPINLRTEEGLSILEEYLHSRVDDDMFVDAEEDVHVIEVGNDTIGSLTNLLENMTLESPPRSLSSSSSFSSDTEYRTPPTSPPPLFLSSVPTKTDVDLLDALSALPSASLSAFPYIRLFMSSLRNIPLTTRSEWPSMLSPRIQTRRSAAALSGYRPRSLF